MGRVIDKAKMTAAFWTRIVKPFPFGPVPRPGFVDGIFRWIQPAEEDRLAARRVIDHPDVVAGCRRRDVLLRPNLTVPLPGLLAALSQIDGPTAIQNEHVPLSVVCRPSQNATRRTSFRDPYP